MKAKRFIAVLLILSALAPLLSCAPPPAEDNGVPLTDADGNTFYVKKDARVACAYGSFAECWLLSGGRLVGVTEDAVSERGLTLDANTAVIGSVKSVSLELLISLRPDLVILSADITTHRQLATELADRGISAPLLRMDSFEDYAAIMRQFCDINGGDGLYREHVTRVKEKTDALLLGIPEDKKGRTVLIMRAYSNGIKVKTDNLAEDIAVELGCVSIAQKYPSMLTDLSIEAIVSSDPDFILVLTMGDSDSATEYLYRYVQSNPALASLRAVKEGRLVVLPKELFHYKPNNKWNESYEYMAKIIYPEIFE